MVSVILPTFNRGRYVTESIESVLNQTYQDIEVIVIDDGSTDNTREVVLGLEDKRVRYEYMEQNQGPSAARNKGAMLAKGAYIAFQDSDDLWMKDKLEQQLRLMDAEDTKMCFCQMEQGEGIYPYEEISKQILGYREWYSVLLQVELIGTPTIVCEREAFLETGGFDTSIKCLEDYEFTLRFAHRYTVSYLAKPLIKVRRVDRGVNSNADEMLRTRCRLLKEYYEDIVKLKLLERRVNIIINMAPHCTPDFSMLQLEDMKAFLESKATGSV